MKRSLILLIYILYSFNTLSKDSQIDSLNNRIKILENISLRHQAFSDSLITIINSSKESDYNEKLLAKYDTLNGTLFTIMGIILAVLGIGIPLFSILYVYRPARENLKETQKLLDDTKNDMDKLFFQYIKKERKNSIDKILTNFEKNDSYAQTNSIQYFNTHMHEGLMINK